MSAPLEGLRVVDLTTDVAGPYATKLLADYGADVIKVEPPGGDPSREAGPFPTDTPDPEASGRFLFLNTNKRSLVLDLADARDRATFERLIAHADAVVEDRAPGELSRLGLGYERLRELRPGIVLASITPWGQTGPYAEAGLRLTDLVGQAMGGSMLWTGIAEREPLRLGGGGALGLYHAGATASLGLAMALLRQERDGVGDHLDIAIYEALMGSRERSAPYMTNHFYNGMEPKRRTSRGITVASGPKPCADGWVLVSALGRLTAFLSMIGLDDLAADPSIGSRTRDPELAGLIEAQYLLWLSERTKGEVAELAQQHRLLAGPVNAISDLAADPHFRERGVWETVDHPGTGPIEYPGRPFVMNVSPRPPARRAPLLDEHRNEVLALASAAAPARSVSTARRRLPLEGVRVADVTAVWAGPHATQLLAEWGAEVIRIEPITRIQPNTRQAERPSTREQEMERASLGIGTGGSYPHFEPGEDWWNRNSGFNSHARNKLSMTCDIMEPEGRSHFLRLVAQCDVVVENNVPETIDRAGIGYEALCAVRPDLVMLRMPAFGLTGPYAHWRAYGSHIESTVGHHAVRGYAGSAPDEGGDVYTADATAGVQGALAVVMALRHRQRTGEGQLVELSQAENFIPMLGELILDWNMKHEERGAWGNRHRSHAPHDAYPTRGEDQWIAIDVATDDEFVKLCRRLGAPEIAADTRFASASSRKQFEEALNVAISERTRSMDKWDLFRALQADGIAAGPLQTAAERAACPQLDARGFFQELDQASVGRFRYPGVMWRMLDTPNWLRRGPCLLGEDNDYVYRNLLGLSPQEVDDLTRRGLIGTGYSPQVLGRTPQRVR